MYLVNRTALSRSRQQVLSKIFNYYESNFTRHYEQGDFFQHSLESPYGLPQRDGPWPLWPKNPHYNWCSLSNKACLTKFRAPMFCFPKEQLNTSSIQKVS